MRYDTSLTCGMILLSHTVLKTCRNLAILSFDQGTDFEIPTLIIAEVVLAYMEPGEGDALAAWAGKRFSIVYSVCMSRSDPTIPLEDLCDGTSCSASVPLDRSLHGQILKRSVHVSAPSLAWMQRT